MRLSWTVACALVALDCAEKASGAQPQHLFVADLIWLWWVAAAIWSVIAAATAVTRWQPAA